MAGRVVEGGREEEEREKNKEDVLRGFEKGAETDG